MGNTKGYVKLHRRVTEWEWYKDPHTSRLFFHLLLIAARFTKDIGGVRIYPGQVLTTERELAEDLGYKWPNQRQTIRTALEHLKSTNEITIQTTKKTTNNKTIITVVNYTHYQGGDVGYNQGYNQENNQDDNQKVTNVQPSPNQPLTNLPIIRERQERKNIKKEEKERAREAELDRMIEREKMEREMLRNLPPAKLKDPREVNRLWGIPDFEDGDL